MPESVRDRPARAHEHLFLFAKSRRYFYEVITLEQRRSAARDVWEIAPQSFKGAHFAVMPEKLVEPCVLAGSEPGDKVLDPFVGSGTVGSVALRHGRSFVGVDLNPEYVEIARQRLQALISPQL